ncbi:MAG TPA: class I SAM-dependent methyltransferase [Acidimicrobiales bacterium]|nr:class I SAM-dependent methyltransferase [Acidimicrobiales bacterium]
MAASGGTDVRSVEDRIARLAAESAVAFELSLPERPMRTVGRGEPAFRLHVHDRAGVEALAALDELRLGEAYLDGHIDIEGDLRAVMDLRPLLTDRRLFTNLWTTMGPSVVLGRVRRDTRAIKQHYESDPEFYLSFLDSVVHGYSNGHYEYEDEALEKAIIRKLDHAIEACEVGPGSSVLDVGVGWGAFTTHAGRRGIRVTGLTISSESRRFVSDLVERDQLPCTVLEQHLFEHRPRVPYDAIVVLGVTEHLPDYRATLKEYERLLRPGGRVFLDASAAPRKYSTSSFARAHVWPGGGSFMHLSSYVRAVEQSRFDVLSVQNDRRNYEITTRQWAENLERNREQIVRRWGERPYRLFRLYLWGSSHALATGALDAYRLLLALPEHARPQRRRWRSNQHAERR